MTKKGKKRFVEEIKKQFEYKPRKDSIVANMEIGVYNYKENKNNERTNNK